ncbi:YceI family protein [Dyella tabacisoli]|uniref:YceI family protein n=1 Tax=Dyella tabacisoli TaxID=2282381 RepID=UPI001CDCC58B|nr:YceI family protein [Dyella tabacisoli]
MHPARAHAIDYRIATERSHAEFGIRLLWLRKITGRFEQIDGDITLSPHHDTATVDARIEVNSIRMDSERFRRWVLAPEFFDAEQYTTIHFISAPVPIAALEQGGALDGWLTLRGVTRPTRFELLPAHCSSSSPQNCLIELHGSIQRGDFGMTGYRTALSDRVELGLVIALDEAR